MKRICFAVFTLFVALICAGIQPKGADAPPLPPGYAEKFEGCRDAYLRGDIASVRKTCAEVIKLSDGVALLLVPPLNVIGLAEKSFGSPRIAIDSLSRAVDILQSNSPHDRLTMATLKDNLGLAYAMVGRSDKALEFFDEDLKVFSENGKARDAATTMANRAVALSSLGRADEALSATRDAVVAADGAFGQNTIEAARARTNMADVLGGIGRDSEALALLDKSLAIIKGVCGTQPSCEDPDRAYAERSIGTILEDQGNHSDAVAHLAIAKQFMEELAPDSIDLAAIQNNLGIALENNGQLELAQQAYQQANSFFVRNDLDTPERAIIEDHLGRVQTELGRCAEGRASSESAVAALERLLGPLATDAIIARSNLAGNLEKCEGPPAAIEEFRRATGALSNSATFAASAVSSTMLRQQRFLRSIYFRHLMAVVDLAITKTNGPSQQDVEESLRLAQLAEATSTSLTIAERAARGNAGAALTDFYKTGEEWRLVERRLIDSVTRGDMEQAQADREKLAELSQRAALLHRAFASDRLTVLAEARPVDLKAVRSVLKSEDAMLILVPGEAGGVGIVITEHDAFLYAITGSAATLAADLEKVRSGLADQGPCPAKKPFDKAAAFRLYSVWFKPAEQFLAKNSISHILYSGGGRLAEVPPDVFITEGHNAANATAAAIEADTSWLVYKYAFSIQPSASAAVYVSSRANDPWDGTVGIGIPNLGSTGKVDCTLAWLGLQDAQVPTSVNQLPNLDEFGDILRSTVADGSRPYLLLIGEQATVANVKQLASGTYKTVIFATHGLMGRDELVGLDEPALVMTPASKAAGSDGLLRGSDIIDWNLGADTVVLVACNSAAADPQTGEASLSGLSRAFFSAGARSVIASYWHAPTEAGIKMLPALVTLANDTGGASKAHALQKLKLEWMRDSSLSEPRDWAAFQLIGAGT